MNVALAFLLLVAAAALYISFDSRRMYLIALAGATFITLAFYQVNGLMQ